VFPVTDVAEVRRVLANWIAQANSTEGRLVDGVIPSEWIADRFLHWWRSEVESDLANAESAITAIDLPCKNWAVGLTRNLAMQCMS
jgi:hypothetical protein